CALALFSVWFVFFFFSSRRRHTRFSRDWSSDVCSSDLWRFDTPAFLVGLGAAERTGFQLELPGADTRRHHAVGDMGGIEPVMGRSEERRVGKECRSGGVAGP